MFLACEVIEYKFSCITKKVATNALEYKHTFPLIHETSISSTSYVFSASRIKELTCGETTFNQRAEDRTIIMNSKEVFKGQGRVEDIFGMKHELLLCYHKRIVILYGPNSKDRNKIGFPVTTFTNSTAIYI